MQQRRKYVYRFTDRHGRDRWRFRKTGHEDYYFRTSPDSPDFEEEYRGCFDGSSQARRALYKRIAPTPTAGRDQVVYFIGASGYGAVKIGLSSNVERRLYDLQRSSPEPLVVLASLGGGKEVERAYHMRFARYRKAGEWFERAPEIEAEIDSLNAATLTNHPMGLAKGGENNG